MGKLEESKGISGIDPENFPAETSPELSGADEETASDHQQSESTSNPGSENSNPEGESGSETDTPSGNDNQAESNISSGNAPQSEGNGNSSRESDSAVSSPGAETSGDQSSEDLLSSEEYVSDPLEETESLTQAPQGTSGGLTVLLSNTKLLYGALALILVLLVCVVIDTFRRNRRQTKPQPSEHKEPDITSVSPEAPIPGAQSDMAPSSGLRTAVLQDMGARDDQQDSYGASDWSDPHAYLRQGTMAVVADGMGGLSNGSAVSSLLVRTFLDGFCTMASHMKPPEMLLELAMRANAQVNQLLRGSGNGGSTLLSAVIKNGYLHFLTVGDSHIYLYRNGTLLQLNREHIYQEELAVKSVNRRMSIQQVYSDRQAHSLTSYFGIGEIPYLDRNDTAIKLIDKDRIILATDGVFGTLSEEQMVQALRLPVDEAARMMGDMIKTADKPYQDNYTALIMEYYGG